MIDGKRVIAVVPARGGSKGMPLKNLRTVGGVPMVARVGHVVRDIDIIDRAVVSTDHEEIARVATAAGLDAPFRRPEDLSDDTISDLDVLTHALIATEDLDQIRYDIVVMLQPTSPLRRPEDVSATVTRLVREGWDSVWTVSRTDSKAHPLKQLAIDESSGVMTYYDLEGANIIARQQLAPVYHRNGAAYAITRDCLLEQKSIMGRRSLGLVLNGQHISIDTEWDITLAELFLDQAKGGQH